jgi:hypothetical protein
MKLTENIEASAWKAISVLKTRSLFAAGQQIRLAGAVAIVAMLASAESLSAQPITGTAATKPLDPKELDGYFADQLSHKPFVGISAKYFPDLTRAQDVRLLGGEGFRQILRRISAGTDTRTSRVDPFRI